MKVLLIVLALVAVVAAKTTKIEDVGVLDYHTKVGIPLATEMRNAEAQQQGPSARIIGGQPALLGQIPFQVGIVINLLTNETSVCGGVLVSPTRVITAAHCWWNRRDQAWRFTVVAGSLNIFTGGQRLPTSHVVMHGGWNPDTNLNNIAMVYMSSRFVLSTTVAVAPLPNSSELNATFAGLIATASGYGLITDGGDIPNNQVLRFVNMLVATNAQCQQFAPSFGNLNICAYDAGNGASTCYGDEGGPLTVTRNGRRILVGIKSFVSPLSCRLGEPVAFVRITSYIDWINRFL